PSSTTIVPRYLSGIRASWSYDTVLACAPVATIADGNARSMPRARAPTDKFMGSDIFMPEAYAAGGATSGISCTSDASEDQGRSARTARRRLPIRSPSQQHQPGGTSNLVGKSVHGRFGIFGVELCDNYHTLPLWCGTA